MKKFYLVSLLLLSVFSLAAQTQWTIQTVPNTRLENNDIHVSDPDGFLSDSTEMHINTALCAIRDKADVFVVTLATIGEAEPKRFATRLFNYWGIGDAETDNGVLLLFVEDQHALEFETGYGAEATLTDAKCQRIFTHTIVPFFRAGDYEGGLCAGVADIVEVYGGEIPMGLKSTLPTADDSYDDTETENDDIGILAIIVFLLMIAMPVVGVVYWISKRGDKKAEEDAVHVTVEDGINYIEGNKTSWSGSPWEGRGCLGALTLGFSLIVFFFITFTIVTTQFPDMTDVRQSNWSALLALVLFFTWICFRQNQRTLKVADKLASRSVNARSVYQAAMDHSSNKLATWMAPWLGWVYHLAFKKRLKESREVQCPLCHNKMKTVSGFNLPEAHAFESSIGAYYFHPYRCSNGHQIVLKENGLNHSKFSTCSKCGVYAMKLVNTKIITKADYSRSGQKEETYTCQHCGETIVKLAVIPKLVRYSSGSSSSSSSGRSYSSSRSSSSHSSSHGSFGGGRSGGGGYSGRW